MQFQINLVPYFLLVSGSGGECVINFPARRGRQSVFSEVSNSCNIVAFPFGCDESAAGGEVFRQLSQYLRTST